LGIIGAGCRRGQVVTPAEPILIPTKVSMGTGSHACASDRTTRSGRRRRLTDVGSGTDRRN
jgi:hypothetical protein